MTKPLFSVISVTMNNLDGLLKTRQSLADQTFRDYEWIVIDGGSEDGTVKYLGSQEKVIWMSEPDQGPYDAMNKGLALAQGAYVIFLNAGDYFADDSVLDRAMSCNGADIIYGDSYEVEGGQMHLKHARAHSYIEALFTHHQSIFYAREAVGDIRYDLTYKIAADFDFTHRVIKGSKEVKRVPAAFAVFEGGGLSHTQAKQGRKELYTIRGVLKLCGSWSNHMIMAKQWGLWHLRQLCPPLFFALRVFTHRLLRR